MRHQNRKPGETPHLMVRGSDGKVVNRVIHKEGAPSPIDGMRMVPDPGPAVADWRPRSHDLVMLGDGTFEKRQKPVKAEQNPEREPNSQKDLATRLAAIEAALGLDPAVPSEPALPEPSVE